jgi:TrpR family transcriptional regulator, trp operon repressor
VQALTVSQNHLAEVSSPSLEHVVAVGAPVLQKHSSDVASFFLSTSGERELSSVLKAILTPAEIEAISQRLSILDGLSNEIAQREIAEQLRVGIATVTRGSRVWQDNREILGRYFPRTRETPNL